MVDSNNPRSQRQGPEADAALAQRYAAVYLAPHLDDAVLSCGGQIFMQTQAGQAVLVLTVMAGAPPRQTMTPFAQLLHERWQLAGEVTAARRAEDAAACAILGADVAHWEIPDCIYRQDPDSGQGYYASNEALFGAVHEAETELVTTLAGRLVALPAYGRLLAPLTVGHHVDHQIVHRAAAALPQERIAYYEDYPYAAVPGALEKVVRPDDPGWRPESIALTEEALRAKIAAIAAYESQVSTFFQSPAELEEMVRRFAADRGGERIWRRLEAYAGP